MTRDIGAMFGASAGDTFMGLPRAETLDEIEARIAILGAPCATPYPSVGAYCAGAPAAIRAGIAGYAANLRHMDFDLGGPIFPDGEVSAVDCGDLPWDEADPAANRIAIRSSVRTILGRGAAPIVIGGDDSIPIPVLEAFHDKGKFTIVQIDAHIDWREEVGGERWGLSSTMRRASEMPHIERIIQIGQRAIGSARVSDVDDARKWGVSFVSARELYASGVAPALDLVPEGAQVIVCFDCDALDPSIMPAVIGPAPGGLTYWQAAEILHGVAARARIAAFNLVEFLPERDIAGQGALVAARLIINAMGLMARQRS